MAQVTLAATVEATNWELNPNLVADLIWVVATPEHGLEHLHAVTQPGRIDVVVFHLAVDTAMARHASRRLCQLAISTSPQLYGWRITSPP